LGAPQSSISLINGIQLQASDAKSIIVGDGEGTGNGTLIRITDNTQIIQLDALSIRTSYLTPSAFLYSGSNRELASTAAATDGQLLIGSTDVDPVLGNLTGGTGISITNGAGSISIASSGLIRATQDAGGAALSQTLTNSDNTGVARSTGVGTILFADVTDRDCAGFIKIYIGASAFFIPVFSAN
jgi:hypothetical protein